MGFSICRRGTPLGLVFRRRRCGLGSIFPRGCFGFGSFGQQFRKCKPIANRGIVVTTEPADQIDRFPIDRPIVEKNLPRHVEAEHLTDADVRSARPVPDGNDLHELALQVNRRLGNAERFDESAFDGCEPSFFEFVDFGIERIGGFVHGVADGVGHDVDDKGSDGP